MERKVGSNNGEWLQEQLTDQSLGVEAVRTLRMALGIGLCFATIISTPFKSSLERWGIGKGLTIITGKKEVH